MSVCNRADRINQGSRKLTAVLDRQIGNRADRIKVQIITETVISQPVTK